MTYEYVCRIHGRFEASNSIENRFKGVCPECGKPAKLIMSVPAQAVFKPALHTDSGNPKDIHAKLKHKHEERFELATKRQGREILPEDM